MADTIYFNGLNAKKSKYGIKLSGKVEKIIEELNKHVNSKGYINLDITERKEADKYGNTHSVKVDTWEPTPKNESNQGNSHSHPMTGINVTDDSSDLPFALFALLGLGSMLATIAF
jgi:hypothetical protein